MGMGVAPSQFGEKVQIFYQKFPLWVGYFGQLISQKSFSQEKISHSPPLKANVTNVSRFRLHVITLYIPDRVAWHLAALLRSVIFPGNLQWQ